MKKGWIFCLLIVAGFFVKGIYNSYQVRLTSVTIADAELAAVFGSLKVVQISDIHSDFLGSREKKIMAILDSVQPDMIFLTGDYVAWKGPYRPALDLLSKIDAPLGVWAVMGDYDYSDSRKSCLFCHAPGTGKATLRHRIRFLKNEVKQVVINGRTITIAGLDDVAQGMDSAVAAIDRSTRTCPAIVMSHSPLGFDRVTSSNHGLFMLAGDTHQGQIPLPKWFWQLIGYEKNAAYNYGYYKQGNKKMFVSSGIGTSHLPVRYFSRPEVVLFRFVE